MSSRGGISSLDSEASYGAPDFATSSAQLSATVAPIVSLTDGTYDYTVAVAGAVQGDIVIVCPTSKPDDAVASWSGVVNDTDTVTIRVVIAGGPGGTTEQEFRVRVLAS